MAENLGSEAGVLQDDGVHVATEGGFERGDEFAIDIEAGDERPGKRGTDALGIVEAFQNSLRTLREAFAFFVELLQDFEA